MLKSGICERAELRAVDDDGEARIERAAIRDADAPQLRALHGRSYVDAERRRVRRDELVLDARADAACRVGRGDDRADDLRERREADADADAVADVGAEARADRHRLRAIVEHRELRLLGIEDAAADDDVGRLVERERDAERGARSMPPNGSGDLCADGGPRHGLRRRPTGEAFARARRAGRRAARVAERELGHANVGRERRVVPRRLVPAGEGRPGRAHRARSRAVAEEVLGRGLGGGCGEHERRRDGDGRPRSHSSPLRASRRPHPAPGIPRLQPLACSSGRHASVRVRSARHAARGLAAAGRTRRDVAAAAVPLVREDAARPQGIAERAFAGVRAHARTGRPGRPGRRRSRCTG